MKYSNMKRIVAILLCIATIFSTCNIVYAGSIPDEYNKEKYFTDGYLDYAKIHGLIFENNGATAPTSKFTVSITRNGEVLSTKGISDSGDILYAQIGDTLTITNTSTPSSGNTLYKCDFQVSDGTSIVYKTTNLNNISLSDIDMTKEGTWNIYLNVMDSEDINNNLLSTEGWGNWAYNGSYKVVGTNPGTGLVGGDFECWWYYSKLTVVVKAPEYTVEEKHIDRDTGKVLFNKTHKGITDSQFTTNNPPKTFTDSQGRSYKFIGSRYGYNFNNDILNGSDKDVQTITTALSNTNPNAFHYYYYQVELPPPPEGTGNVTVCYINKNTGDAAKPALQDYGKPYGTYTYEAPEIAGYTFDPSIISSPQTVTLSKDNPSVTITFYYTPDGEGGGGEPDNEPPVAVITGPDEELAGANCKFDGRNSYDRDGTIEEYIWEFPGATISQMGNGFIVVWYPYIDEYIRTEYVRLTVVDDKGATDTTEAAIDILKPVPTAVLNISGTYKENRKVTLDASESKSPARYPINSYIWTISNAANVKSVNELNGNPKNDVIYKIAGKYSNKIVVTNTLGYSDEETKSVTIVPDQNPIADFAVTTKLLREPDESNTATITISNLSSSPDSDRIKKTVLFYSYDSDNDGNFDEEVWKYSTDGITWQNVGLPYRNIKTHFDIYNIEGGNPLIIICG